MSEVSRFMTSPSLEGTLADSLISCVRIDISLLDLNGYTRCTPSDSTSPVTRPKRVSTPTFPDSTSQPMKTAIAPLRIRQPQFRADGTQDSDSHQSPCPGPQRKLS